MVSFTILPEILDCKEKVITMKTHKRTQNQTKSLEGMDKVYDKLIQFKKKMNSELIILKDNQIVRVKPQ